MHRESRSRRDFLKLCSASAVGLILAACKTTGEQQSTNAIAPTKQPLDLVVMLDEKDLQEEDILQFATDYAPNRLTRIDVSLDSFKAMAAAGQAVDALRLEVLQIPFAVKRGWCNDLSSYFASSAAITPEDLLPINNSCLVQGKRYGMILDWSPDYSIWINKKLWRDAGVPIPESYEQGFTLARWRELSKMLSHQENNPVKIIGTDFEPGSRFLFWIAATLDPPHSLFRDIERRIVLKDDPEIFTAIRFIEEWKQEGGLPVDLAAVHAAEKSNINADFDCL
jgi:ABC-type glycerol-3-phosphate transport system substrate-binding protein